MKVKKFFICLFAATSLLSILVSPTTVEGNQIEIAPTCTVGDGQWVAEVVRQTLWIPIDIMGDVWWHQTLIRGERVTAYRRTTRWPNYTYVIRNGVWGRVRTADLSRVPGIC